MKKKEDWRGKWLSRLLFVDNGTCPVCGRVLFSAEAFLCSRCLEELPINRGRVCTLCGRPMLDIETTVCSECRREEDPVFDGGFSWLGYTEGARDVVRGYKFESRRELAGWVGRQMAGDCAACPWIREIDAIAAVPLNSNRLAQRGYNQSLEMALGLADGLGKHGVVLKVLESALERPVDTPHQVGEDREFRTQNVHGAFSVAEPWAVEGKKLILVDDVITTGSTLRECGRTLKAAGAAGIYAVTCAARP